MELVCADGRAGYAPRAPYDAIHVGAAAQSLADALVQQLKSPGRMFIPVGTDAQEVVLVEKDEEGVVSKKRLFGVMVRTCQWDATVLMMLMMLMVVKEKRGINRERWSDNQRGDGGGGGWGWEDGEWGGREVRDIKY